MRLPVPAFLALALATLLSCRGSEEPIPAPEIRLATPAPGTLLIHDVAVLDVENGTLLRGRDVVVSEGRIAGIRPTRGPDAPADARVVSGRGATLVPGLVDMHGHIDAFSGPTWELRPADHDANLRAYLYAGVTTVFDPADNSGDAFARRDRVAAGRQLGPRIYTSGPIVTMTNGHPIAMVDALAPWWIAWAVAPTVATGVDGPEEARAAVDEIAAGGADFIKIASDAIPLDAQLMPPEVMRAVVDQARSHDLRVVAHIGTARDAIDAGRAGVAAWVHGVYKEPLSDEQVAAIAAFDIPMIATLEVFDRYARSLKGPRQATALEREIVDARTLDAFWPPPDDFELGALEGWLALAQEQREAKFENVRRLRAAGVTILAGSDTQSGVFPGAGLHRELALLVRAGMTPTEAIRAATLDAARFIEERPDPEVGRIAVGARADLLLVEGDPTADVAALADIREVFRGGIPLERRAVASR